MIFLKKVVGIFYHGGKQEKKKKRTQQRTPTKCESGRAGYGQKSYKQDHGGQIIR